jgi:hypothetical protein
MTDAVAAAMKEMSDQVYELGKVHGRLDTLNEVLNIIVQHERSTSPVFEDVRHLIKRTIESYPKGIVPANKEIAA